MFKCVLLVAAAFLAAALTVPVAAQSPFELKNSDMLERYDRFQGYTMHFGPEDKFLEVNGMPIFVDLQEVWEEFGVASRANGTDCQFLFSEGPIPFNTCQANCSGNPNNKWSASTLCNAVNYNFAPIDPAAPTPTDALCEYLSCNDNPPATVPEAGWMLWTYNRGTVVVTPDGGSTWNGMEVNSSAPCFGSANPNVPLVPRDNAYAVGIVNNRGVGGGDRIIVLGGDATENNVYYSDDGGLQFSCYDGTQIWSARGYALIAHPTGIFPNDPVFLMGGYVNESVPSIGIFVNTGDGTANWARPTCTPGSCAQVCSDAPGTYCLPSTVLPGQVAWTWDTMYLWSDDAVNTVFELNAASYGQGWAVTGASATSGVPGTRRVFIKGPNVGSGCFFSTDFTAKHLWLPGADATSTNAFATSKSPLGPWVPGTAPWDARGSAVVTTSEDQTKAWVGGGFSFFSGVVDKPTHGDLWTVDSTVCLLGANGVQCSGHALDVDLANVVCNCLPNWAGDDRCGSCTPGLAYNPDAGCPECAVAFGGGPCNVENGWGVCDPVAGCVCNFGHDGANCGQCAVGHFGEVCAACAPCDAVGGFCDGSGSSIGTGTCKCNDGYTGADCSQRISPSPLPPPSAAAAGLSSGAAAAVALLVVGLAIGASLFVYGKFLGGGPVLAAAAAKVRGLVPSSFGGTERVSLLASNKGGALSPVAAQARFGGAAAVDVPSKTFP